MKYILFAVILLLLNSPMIVGKEGFLLLPIAIAAWFLWGSRSKRKAGEEETGGSQTSYWDRDPLPTYPKEGRCQYGTMDFSDPEWDKSDGKMINRSNGVTLSQDIYGNWVTDDDPDESGTSNYYGWYTIDD